MRTRKLLQQAMSELLAEKSFLSISVQDITTRATVNRATFYAHFEDKFSIFESLIRDGFQEYLETKIGPAPELSDQGLKNLVATVIEYMGKLNSRCRKTDRRMDPLVESTAQDTLQKYLLQALERDGSSSIPQTQACVLSWAIFGASVQWSRSERTKSSEQLAEEVCQALQHHCSK